MITETIKNIQFIELKRNEWISYLNVLMFQDELQSLIETELQRLKSQEVSAQAYVTVKD